MKFKLTINEPCHENWENMTPDEKGRFCAHCSKSVHDFTNYAPQEIADTIKNNPGTCGRVPTKYLNQTFELTQVIGSAGALALLSLTSCTQQFLTMRDSNLPDTIQSSARADTNEVYIKITGLVKNELGGVIGGAGLDVMSRDTSVLKTYSLSTGGFTVFIDRRKIGSDSVKIIVTKEGYFPTERMVSLTDTSTWNDDFILVSAAIGWLPGNVQPWQIITTQGAMPIFVYGNMIIPGLTTVSIFFPPASPHQRSDKSTQVKLNTLFSRSADPSSASITANPYDTQKPTEDPAENLRVEITGILNDDNRMEVYPNPANDFLVIEFMFSSTYQVSITDREEKIWEQWEFTGKDCRAIVAHIPAGMYTLTAIDTSTLQAYVHTLVIKR